MKMADSPLQCRFPKISTYMVINVIALFIAIIVSVCYFYGYQSPFNTQIFIPQQASLPLPLLILTFAPLANFFQKLFYGSTKKEPNETELFDPSIILQQYGHKLITTPLDTDLILQMLLQQTQEAFGPETGFVFIRDPVKSVFNIRGQLNNQSSHNVEIRFGLDDDLVKWIEDTNEILQLEGKEMSNTEAIIAQEELARLKMLDVVLCIPLASSEDLIGWLAIGQKQTRTLYSREDIVLLDTLANQTAIALGNAQLLEQANQRAAELEALQKISAEIQAEAQPDKLLTLVVEQATKLLQAQGGMVYLLEPDNKTLKIVVCHNLDQDYCQCTVVVGEDVAGQVVTQNTSLIVDSYHNYNKRSVQFKDAKFGAVLGVPLRWDGKVRGVLQLAHRLNGPRFSPHDLWLIEFFANQSALSLEKSRLLKKAQDRAHHLAILSEVSMAISSTLDLDTTLQRIMDQAVQILSAEAGSLLLVDGSGKELTFEVVLGPTGEDLKGIKTPIGKGIVGTVAKTGKPLIVNDVAADPRWNVAFDEATDFQTKDILCVPMIVFDQHVVGVIEVINRQDGAVFNEEDSSLLLSFAAQAAIAIENARIFTRTDLALAERAQELLALQMFDQQLQSSLELDTVLNISLDHMMDALGISMGLIGIFKGNDRTGLYLLTQRGMPAEMGRYKIDPWPISKGMVGQVAKTGEIAWINDLSEASGYVPKNHRTRSVLIVPIVREERVIGIIDLESTDHDYFTSDDVAFVRLMTSHSAIAIENAHLFEQVKTANDAKSEFMQFATHELKTPMTSIKGYTKLMQMGATGPLTEKQADFLEVITNNVDRMDRLVQDLLDVSRIEAGRIRLEIENVQIRDVIEEVLTSVKTQVENKHLNLIVDMMDDLPELRADYRRMVQIVTNLVSNAYKYTPQGGQISVLAAPVNGNGQAVAVTVSDTGYGISEEDQAQLFTTFFRAGDQNIRNEPGTGLGLSITKNMVESHGGQLSFESELGKGSSFTITFPLISKIPPGVEVIER